MANLGVSMHNPQHAQKILMHNLVPAGYPGTLPSKSAASHCACTIAAAHLLMHRHCLHKHPCRGCTLSRAPTGQSTAPVLHEITQHTLDTWVEYQVIKADTDINQTPGTTACHASGTLSRICCGHCPRAPSDSQLKTQWTAHSPASLWHTNEPV